MKRVLPFALIVFSVLIFSDTLDAQKSKSLAGRMIPATPATEAKETRFEGITAVTDGRSTWLTWTMEAEVGNVGFNVYRVGRKGTELLTPERIVRGVASVIPQYGQSYFFYDQVGDGASAYFVETLGLNGQRLASQQIYPRYVATLEAATGLTPEQMVKTTFRPRRLETAAPIFAKDLASEIQQYQQLADSATHRMVISQPGVARIGVKREGLYRVTSAQLQAAGFNVSSDPTNWQLYVEGVQQAMIVGFGGSYIEFYGRGTDTRETDIRQYYLMNGTTPGRRMGQWVAHPNTSTVVTRNYAQTFIKKERTNYVDDVINGDTENYFGRVITSNPNAAPMTFNLSGIDFSSVDSTMRLSFQGYSAGADSIEVIFNGEVLAPASGMNKDNFAADYAIPTSLLHEGSNSVKFRAIGPAGDFVFFDTMRISFKRTFLADGNSLNFSSQNYRVTRIGGFTSANIRVFDITRDGEPIVLNNLTALQNGPTFGIELPAERGRSFYAVEDTGILAADSVTANNPELLGIPANSAELLIISYKDFMVQAEAWAQYRRNQGVTVKVVEVSEIFDEFNFGTFSSEAIEDFLHYTYDNWQGRPHYVMLLGDASWDSRNYENTGNWNFVPPKMVATVYSEAPSDDALADFDNDGLAEMAVGRIAVRNATDLNTQFTKTVNWEASLTPTSLQRGALFAYDFNNGYTFDIMSQRLGNELPPGTPSTYVFRGEANANANLITAMNTGKYIVNYSGHGTAGSWGGSPIFFNVTSVPTTSDHNPSIYTMLTCLNGFYHWLYFPSMAEVLLNAPNKGAVVAWGSSGLTLPNFQEDMATRFYHKLSEGTIPRMGDLVRDAKTQVLGTDVRNSYALLGDPMLKVR